jgi:hypothetical protein
MPGPIGYMLAIVITLGGYLAGLHWLINPPDPWRPNPKIAQSNAQKFGARKRLPAIVKSATADVASELTALTKLDAKLASVQMPTSVQTSENETARPTIQNPMQAARPVAEPAHILRREVLATKTKPINRTPVGRNTSRKLELMVLRTYERSEGRRFTRLRSLNSVRNASAFQPDHQW